MEYLQSASEIQRQYRRGTEGAMRSDTSMTFFLLWLSTKVPANRLTKM